MKMISKWLCAFLLMFLLTTPATAQAATEPMAAGSIIYTVIDGEKFLLLADHKNDRGWGSFGGGRDGKSVIDTAVAESHEETAG